MLNTAKLPWNLRHKLWAQWANLSTQLENIIYSPIFDASPYEMIHNTKPEWLDNLHTFVEIAIVHEGSKDKIRAKLQDKGLASMFVGYPVNHASEVCQFLNLKTKKSISSRTAIFLHKTYADYYHLAKEFISRVEHPIIDDLNMEADETPTLINIQPDPPEDEEEEPFKTWLKIFQKIMILMKTFQMQQFQQKDSENSET
jgi:hypothetical protein